MTEKEKLAAALKAFEQVKLNCNSPRLTSVIAREAIKMLQS